MRKFLKIKDVVKNNKTNTSITIINRIAKNDISNIITEDNYEENKCSLKILNKEGKTIYSQTYTDGFEFDKIVDNIEKELDSEE